MSPLLLNWRGFQLLDNTKKWLCKTKTPHMNTLAAFHYWKTWELSWGWSMQTKWITVLILNISAPKTKYCNLKQIERSLKTKNSQVLSTEKVNNIDPISSYRLVNITFVPERKKISSRKGILYHWSWH